MRAPVRRSEPGGASARIPFAQIEYPLPRSLAHIPIPTLGLARACVPDGVPLPTPKFAREEEKLCPLAPVPKSDAHVYRTHRRACTCA